MFLSRGILYNDVLRKPPPPSANWPSARQAAAPVRQFGFSVPTCCGRIPQANHWHQDWVEFLARDKLEPQVSICWAAA